MLAADHELRPDLGLGGKIRPGLEQEHAAARILAEPRGDHAAGRAGPNDDHVKMLAHDRPMPLDIRPAAPWDASTQARAETAR